MNQQSIAEPLLLEALHLGCVQMKDRFFGFDQRDEQIVADALLRKIDQVAQRDRFGGRGESAKEHKNREKLPHEWLGCKPLARKMGTGLNYSPLERLNN